MSLKSNNRGKIIINNNPINENILIELIGEKCVEFSQIQLMTS